VQSMTNTDTADVVGTAKQVAELARAGSDPTPIAGVIPAADALIGNLLVPPIGGGFLDPSVTGTLTSALDDWITANDCSSDSTD